MLLKSRVWSRSRSRSPPECGFWPGVGVGVFLLRQNPTPSTYNECYNENFAGTLLNTVVHLLLEEFTPWAIKRSQLVLSVTL